MEYDKKISEFSEKIKHHTKIVAFTGAGISTGSGIPDLLKISAILEAEKEYRGGIFGMLNRSFSTKNPSLFYNLYRKTFFHPQAKPNIAHNFLGDLEKSGKLIGIATMNIDFLHQKSGNKNVYEYWGNMRMNGCAQCHKEYDWDIVEKEAIPKCKLCGGIIVPDFVYRNLATYQENVQAGEAMINRADLIIVVGTRQGGRSFPKKAQKIIINREEPYYRDNNTLFIQGDASKVFKDVLFKPNIS